MEWGFGFVVGWILGYVAGKNKNWWELSKEEKKKRLPILIILLVSLVLGVFVTFLLK